MYIAPGQINAAFGMFDMFDFPSQMHLLIQSRADSITP